MEQQPTTRTAPPREFSGEGEFADHQIGNRDCPDCGGWTERPLCTCGGVIHRTYWDESYDPETGDESVYYLFACDRCGPRYLEE